MFLPMKKKLIEQSLKVPKEANEKTNWLVFVTRRPAITGHRQFFCLLILKKMPSKKMKTFFFEKILFLHICSNFSKLKNFLICWEKNFTIKVGKDILGNYII